MGLCLVFAGGAALVSAAGFATGAEPADAPPQLILPGGNAPKWKNSAQLQQFAAKGDPPACFALGVRLMDGDGFPLDLERARTLFEQAAKGGVADAWFRLGKIYCEGLGVPQDYSRGLGYYTEGANRGVPEAQHNIGAMLVSARGVKRDYVEGLAWLILAGKSGADSGAETQVRARLVKRPADIAAAEARATQLVDEIKQSKPVAPKAILLEAVAKPAESTHFEPEKVAPPRIDQAAPKIEIAVPVAPPPAVAPGN